MRRWLTRRCATQVLPSARWISCRTWPVTKSRPNTTVEQAPACDRGLPRYSGDCPFELGNPERFAKNWPAIKFSRHDRRISARRYKSLPGIAQRGSDRLARFAIGKVNIQYCEVEISLRDEIQRLRDGRCGYHDLVSKYV